MDPPFGRDLAPACCRLLEARGWLAPRAKIYLETERGLALNGLPDAWRLLRAKQAGNVACQLFQRQPLYAPQCGDYREDA